MYVCTPQNQSTPQVAHPPTDEHRFCHLMSLCLTFKRGVLCQFIQCFADIIVKPIQDTQGLLWWEVIAIPCHLDKPFNWRGSHTETAMQCAITEQAAMQDNGFHAVHVIPCNSPTGADKHGSMTSFLLWHVMHSISQCLIMHFSNNRSVAHLATYIKWKWYAMVSCLLLETSLIWYKTM